MAPLASPLVRCSDYLVAAEIVAIDLDAEFLAAGQPQCCPLSHTHSVRPPWENSSLLTGAMGVLLVMQARGPRASLRSGL